MFADVKPDKDLIELLKVIKENGFTSYSNDIQIVE